MLTDNAVWDDTSFYVPIGFPFSFRGVIYDSVTVESNGALFLKDFEELNIDTIGTGDEERLIVNDTLPAISPFGELFQGMNLIDKGYFDSVSRSSIHYKHSGASPNRVFELEYRNAGFKSIDSLFKDDSLTVQIRLHETTNEITFHYGESNASDSTLFDNIRGAVIGVGELSTIDQYYLPNGYFLSGDPLNPQTDYDLHFMRKMPPAKMLYSFLPSPVNAKVSITADNNPVCVKDTIIFEAFLTNAGASPLYQWEVNKVVQGSDSSKFLGINLSDGDSVRCIVTPSALCANGLPAVSNRIIVLQPRLDVSITVDKDPSCPQDSLTFTALVVNGGNATYGWRKNGLGVGTNNPVYKDKNFNDEDTVYCVVTSSLSCAINSPDTSNRIVINHHIIVVSGISIGSDKASICNGDSVRFTATPVNGGTNPVYIWKANDVIQGSDSSTFLAKNLADGAKVTCSMIPDLPCSDTLSSNEITISVIPVPTATLSVQSGVTQICQGSSVTFTASFTNEGSSPSYQWKINSANTGTNDSEFITTALNDKDTVYCIMTSNKTCVANPVLASNKIVMNVLPVPSSSLNFPTSQITKICPGEDLFLSVDPAGTGISPVYNWYINDVALNINSTSYNAQGLIDGDKIYAVMQSSLNCKQGRPDTTKILTINVPAVTQAGITIEADANPVCSSGTINFTSSVQNEGDNPQYNWFFNNAPVGNGSPSITLTGFSDQDKVFCVLTSDKDCVAGSPVHSDTIAVGVLAIPVSSVSIVSDKNTVCTGEKVTFEATVLNPGANPVYQWKHNNNNVGGNSLIYSASNFADEDSVWCVLTTGISCQGDIPQSNKVKIAIRSVPGASVSIASSQPEVCKGGSLTFTANVTNPGNNPAYQWYVNNSPASNSPGNFTSQNFTNGDLVRCEVTSGHNCQAISNTLFVTVNPLLAKVDINPDNTVICNGEKVRFETQATNTVLSYKWFINQTLQSSANDYFESFLLSNQDRVYCVADFGENCIDTSNKVTITVKVSCVNGTADALAKAGIKIFPVPATDYLEVSFEKGDNWTIALLDFSGKEVWNENGINGNRVIDLNGIQKGLYLMRIIKEEKVLLKKIIIQ